MIRYRIQAALQRFELLAHVLRFAAIGYGVALILGLFRHGVKYEDMNTGPMISVGPMTLFVWRKCYRSSSFSFDADGVFAIVTPWFMLYPW